jgi:hypothetical protein
MQSDQWHPSDIESAAQDDQSAAKKRLTKTAPTSESPPVESPKKPATSGIMTLDRDSASKPAASQGEQVAQQPDVLDRLRETASRCISHYEQWRGGGDGEGDLTNALHELRRVLARIEIELAASHADEGAQRAIPIPLHRAHNKDRY